VLLDVVSAILEDNTLFIEPYVSNLPNPSQLSKLIDFVCTAIITCYIVNHSPFHAFTVSCHSLAHVRCSDALPSAYATFYDISVPLVALISLDKSKGTREGAIRGLVGIGKEAVRKGLVEGDGVKVVGSECMRGETGPLVDSVMVSISSHSCDHANCAFEHTAFCILHQTCLSH